MVESTLSPAQVLSLVNRLPAPTKREVLFALATSAARSAQRRRRLAQTRLRQLAAAKGKEWGRMTDEDREQFIDDLLHEGKAYS